MEPRVPDDNLFDDTTKSLENDPVVKPEPKSDGGPSLEGIHQKLDQLGSAGVETTESLKATVESLQSQLAQMQVQAAQAAQAAQPQVDPSERFQELYQDPDGYINKQASAAAIQQLQRLGPHLKLQAEQSRDVLVEQQKSQVNKEYGEGTWEDLFEDGFKNVLENMPLEMQASKDHVDSAVSAILGGMVRNPEMLSKLEERRTEVRKRQSAPSMMSGVRSAPRGTGLNDEEKEFLASLERSGMKMDPKEYVQYRDAGDNEDQWVSLKEANA
jgi:hypothetical protein